MKNVVGFTEHLYNIKFKYFNTCLILSHKEINLHVHESIDLELFQQQKRKIIARTFSVSISIYVINIKLPMIYLLYQKLCSF